MIVRKAVIPAAGFGTRFLPATKALPKEMLPIVDRPVIQMVVEEAVASGLTDILLVISRGKRPIEEHFDRHSDLERQLEAQGRTGPLAELRRLSTMAHIHYLWQPEMRGLGDAVRLARHHIGDEAFAVLLGDTVLESADPDRPVLRQLLEVHQAHGGLVVACEQVPREKVRRYGIIDGTPINDDTYHINGLVEKPEPAVAPSDLAIASRYVLPPTIFACLDRTPPGKGGELQLTDAMRLVLGSGPAHARRIAGRRWDIGGALGYVQANLHFALQRRELADELRPWLTRLLAGEVGSGSE